MRMVMVVRCLLHLDLFFITWQHIQSLFMRFLVVCFLQFCEAPIVVNYHLLYKQHFVCVRVQFSQYSVFSFIGGNLTGEDQHAYHVARTLSKINPANPCYTRIAPKVTRKQV